ncbi:MAG: GNAT family N-acetyltransferase [Actinomycetota bacterium]|nr:GNAT family N-acetyltransferase [Actinomycetota bacterium]
MEIRPALPTRAMGIRPALPRDAALIAELLSALGYPAAPEEVRTRLNALDDSDCVLVTEGGMIALHRIPRVAEGDHLARITALVVSPGRRGSGLGQALLLAAEEVARRWACDLIEVSSGQRPERDAAHRFYRAAGFEDAGAVSVRYWKRLDRP